MYVVVLYKYINSYSTKHVNSLTKRNDYPKKEGMRYETNKYSNKKKETYTPNQ